MIFARRLLLRVMRGEIMKKRIIASCLVALSACAFVGCGNAAVGTKYVGEYWKKDYDNAAAVSSVYERLVYRVSAEGYEKDWGGSKVENNLVFDIDESRSRYVTELTTNADNTRYVYKTELTVYGEYRIDDKVLAVIDGDKIVSSTEFYGFQDGFKPVKSEKTVSNTVLEYKDSGAYEFEKREYRTTAEYDGTTALSSAEVVDGNFEAAFEERVKNVVKIKKYAKNNYIDNELIFLLFRNFKYDSSTSYSFNSIDNVSGELKSVNGSVMTTSSSTESTQGSVAVVPYTAKDCSLSGGNIGKGDKDFDVCKMSFSTTDKYGQTFAKVFYATAVRSSSTSSSESAAEVNTVRHVPVVIMQPLLYNLGVMKCSLDTATFA